MKACTSTVNFFERSSKYDTHISSPKPRPTTIACSSTRNILLDQQSKFQEVDVIKSFGELKSKLIDNKYDFHRFSIFLSFRTP